MGELVRSSNSVSCIHYRTSDSPPLLTSYSATSVAAGCRFTLFKSLCAARPQPRMQIRNVRNVRCCNVFQKQREHLRGQPGQRRRGVCGTKHGNEGESQRRPIKAPASTCFILKLNQGTFEQIGPINHLPRLCNCELVTLTPLESSF